MTVTRDPAQTSWVCPTCGKSMASEGGFKIHVENHAGRLPTEAVAEAAPSPKPARASSKVSEPAPVVVLPPEVVKKAAADDPLLDGTRLSRKTVTGTWIVTMSAAGEGASVSPALEEAFLTALREVGARVSTQSDSSSSCHYSAELSVHADGVLTAVLHGISHFQAAASSAKLPAVRIVSIEARDAVATGGFDDDR